MGIKVEFNPDLALRAFGTKERLEEECLPEEIIIGQSHRFLKEGQRIYSLEREIPLTETTGNQNISGTRASVRILGVEHCIIQEKVYTRGIYQIKKVY